MNWFTDPENQWLFTGSLHELVDDCGNLIVNGRSVPVTWIFCTEHYREHDGDTLYITGLAYGADGTFYGLRVIYESREDRREVVTQLHGKQALAWFAQAASWDEAFARELCRAIDNPQFEFMDLVPVNAKKPRRRGRRENAAAGTFHQQLHLATALVETVRKLDAEPSVENLTEACRASSALHQAMHQPENFQRVSAA